MPRPRPSCSACGRPADCAVRVLTYEYGGTRVHRQVSNRGYCDACLPMFAHPGAVATTGPGVVAPGLAAASAKGGAQAQGKEATAPDWAQVIRQARAGGLDWPAALRALRLHWPRRPSGRRPDPYTTEAMALRQQGCAWPRVYSACIPGFAAMSPSEQWAKAKQLQDRAGARRRAQQRRKIAGGKSTPTNSAT